MISLLQKEFRRVVIVLGAVATLSVGVYGFLAMLDSKIDKAVAASSVKNEVKVLHLLEDIRERQEDLRERLARIEGKLDD